MENNINMELMKKMMIFTRKVHGHRPPFGEHGPCGHRPPEPPFGEHGPGSFEEDQDILPDGLFVFDDTRGSLRTQKQFSKEALITLGEKS